MKFKVGDRVRHVRKAYSNFGRIGTIKAFSKDPFLGEDVLLIWDNEPESHYISSDYLELIKPEKPKVTEGTHMWCSQFNCWCDDVTEVVDIYPICDGDCEGCIHLELVKPSAIRGGIR